ncbi:MAG: cytochrome ubiquinol oxidase subunit I [Acidobacteriota bacterium]
MDTLTAARAQMEVSLGFHMIFAALGIALPVLLIISEGLWLRTGKPHYRDLARKWGKATALTFAIGAVSGTALSFELGLLWPHFMAFAGSIIGPAFALEGYAFFIEAIFIGLYLYGWDRLSAKAHWLTAFPVAISGLLSGVLVVAANAWMQVPSGFQVVAGKVTDVNVFAAFSSPTWLTMALHTTLSCYIAVGFAVAGVYAFGMLRGRFDDYHRSALRISLVMATIAALLQPLSGDINARQTAKYQPAKLAAMEAHFETQAGAPIIIGGIPDKDSGEVKWAIKIPKALSLLVAHDPDAVVTGLNDIPVSQRPNVLLTHIGFQFMVAAGFILIALGLWFWWKYWKYRDVEGKWLLRALVAGAPLGFLALEAGWFVTEVGRQPWVIYGLMTTREAVTPAPNVPITFIIFTVLYLILGVILTIMLKQLSKYSPQTAAPPANQEDIKDAA